MPSSQAVLLWIKERLPQHFEAVLARARALEQACTTENAAAKA